MSWPLIALIALLIFWVSLFILLTAWPRSANKSISQHAASNKNAYLFFSTVQACVGIILYLFVIFWFVPHFELNKLFLVVYTLSAWLQIISSFIPDDMHGKKSALHQTLANPFAVGMFVITFLLLLAPTINAWPKVILALVATFMVYCMGLILPKKGKPQLLKNYLLLQVIYIVSFQIAFLTVTFFG